MYRKINSWYRGKVAEQIAQALSSYYYGLPSMGVKTLGGAKAAIAYFALASRPKDYLCVYEMAERIGFGYLESGGVQLSNEEKTVSIDEIDLSKSRLVYDTGELHGLNLFRLIIVNWGIRRRMKQDRAAADAEYRRQEDYLKSVEISRDRVELLKSIYVSFCSCGPEEFTVVDLISAIYGDEWQCSHSAYTYEIKYLFLLQGFVAERLIEERNGKYIATSTISGAIYEYDKDMSRYAEQMSMQRQMYLTQKRTVWIAVCALIVSATSSIIQLIVGR